MTGTLLGAALAVLLVAASGCGDAEEPRRPAPPRARETYRDRL
jgi:hypothetical protein